MNRTLAIATLLFLFGCDQKQIESKANAPLPQRDLKSDYDFQERCGKAAAAWFKVRHGDGTESSTKESRISFDFSNHYNHKLNKCFVLTVGMVYSKDDLITSQRLNDVNENKMYGEIMENKKNGWIVCNVLKTPCASIFEWEKLVKPYMED